MSSDSENEIICERNKQIWNDTSDSSDSDDCEDRRIQRAPRNFRRRCDHFNEWNAAEFRMRFRLSKETVLMLEERIGHHISPTTARNHAVTAMQQILLFLRFCATGCMLQTIGDFVGIHKSTASQIVKRVATAVVTILAPEYIKMPRGEGVNSVMTKFYEIARFPRVIGAIDCTHVKIISPGGENAEIFRNRKGYFSLNIQVIGDSNLRVRDIVARWPGSSHDQTIFSHSRIHARFEAGEFDAILLGDSGYGLKQYLITPLLNPTTEAEHLFNESQIRSRNPIERLFGVMKRRFPVLSLGIRLAPNTAQSLIIGCAILHNMALDMKEPEPIEDPHFYVANGEENDEENNVHNNNQLNYREEFVLYFMNLLNE